ncbi:ParB/RepB/Spo0J family partition protein [Streptomyces sp. NPDC050560]|uniref:ParB/RepB/Spo0J family partition protein n=1 Tax=Streptomyces sp. NPDC050560 TaxID=3365630 RepID=UPI003789FD23
MTAIERVPVNSLVTGGSPRLNGEDEEHVRNLADTQGPLPPLVVCRRSMRVIDGRHRLRAAVLQGREYVDVRFYDGTEEDAFVLAVRLNTEHGLPLSRADRLTAAQRIISSHPEWSDRLIAEASGISDKTVAKLRCATAELPHLYTRTGCDGRTRPLSTSEGRERAAALFAERPGASLREVSRECGISVGTARDVKDRVRRGVSPLPGDRQGPDEEASAPEAEPPPQAPPWSCGLPEVLSALKRDPSLRLTNIGRLFLRLALSHPSDATEWEQLARGLPPHCLDRVLQLARSNVDAWQHFAAVVESRRHHTHH